MFSRIKNFVYRHKRKFLVSSLLIGGAVIATRYAQRKLSEWQEKEVKEFLEKSKKEHHFRSTERTCNQTIHSLGETLKESIMKIVVTEDLLMQIRQSDSNKVVLWDELKILVITQVTSLLYAGLMLVILLKIQLNIMSGYMFRENIDEESNTLSSSFQTNYLSLCQHFLTTGAKLLCSIIEKHVRLVVTGISLKQQMTLQDIEQIFWGVQTSLSDDPLDPIKNLTKFVVPPYDKLNFEDRDADLMKRIISETYELLECEDVISITDSSIKRAFSNTVDEVASYYLSKNTLNGVSAKLKTPEANLLKEEEEIINVSHITVPLAKVIPVLHGLFIMPSSNDRIDIWVYQFLMMDKINMLGANLYDAYSTNQENLRAN